MHPRIALLCAIGLTLVLAASSGAGSQSTEVETVVGHTVGQRPIVATSLGDGPVEVVVMGGLHTGEEANSVTLVTLLLDHYKARPNEIPAEITLTFIPAVNLDGLVLGTRVNANNVDLNRNWPTDDWAPFAQHGSEIVSGGSAPLSEPETAALYDFLLEREPEVVVVIHAFAALLQHNAAPNAQSYGAAYAAEAGYELISEWPFYPITGELIIAMEEEGIAALDVELSSYQAVDFGPNLRGLKALLITAAVTASGSATCPAYGTHYQQICVDELLFETYSDGTCGTHVAHIGACEEPLPERGPNKAYVPGLTREGEEEAPAE